MLRVCSGRLFLLEETLLEPNLPTVFLVEHERFGATAQNPHVTIVLAEQRVTMIVIMILFPSAEAQTKLRERASV